LFNKYWKFGVAILCILILLIVLICVVYTVRSTPSTSQVTQPVINSAPLPVTSTPVPTPITQTAPMDPTAQASTVPMTQTTPLPTSQGTAPEAKSQGFFSRIFGQKEKPPVQTTPLSQVSEVPPKVGGRNTRNSKTTQIGKGKTSSTISKALKEMKKIKYKSGKLMKGGCDCSLPVPN